MRVNERGGDERGQTQKNIWTSRLLDQSGPRANSVKKHIQGIAWIPKKFQRQDCMQQWCRWGPAVKSSVRGRDSVDKLYTVHCSLYTLHFTLHTVDCQLYPELFTVYSDTVINNTLFIQLFKANFCYLTLLPNILPTF